MEDEVISPEELAEEQEALGEAKEELVRAGIAEALGLADDDDNKEVLDRAVKREMKQRTTFSKVVGQKIKYRDLAKAGKPQEEAGDKGKNLDSDSILKQAEAATAKRFNEEYLEDSDYSDEIKTSIREWIDFKGVSAKAATKVPHIAKAIEEHKKQQKNLEAGENGSGAGKSGKDASEGMPKQFTDPAYMITPEGQKAFAEWDKTRKASK